MLFRACAYCDHPNPVGTNFCNDCGAALHLQPCRQCGAVSVIKARNCPSCKAPFPERPLIDVSIPWAGEPASKQIRTTRSLTPPGSVPGSGRQPAVPGQPPGAPLRPPPQSLTPGAARPPAPDLARPERRRGEALPDRAAGSGRPQAEAAAFTRRLLAKASQSSLLDPGGDSPSLRDELIIPAPPRRQPAPTPTEPAHGGRSEDPVPAGLSDARSSGLLSAPQYQADAGSSAPARHSSVIDQPGRAVHSGARRALVLAAVLVAAGITWWVVEQELRTSGVQVTAPGSAAPGYAAPGSAAPGRTNSESTAGTPDAASRPAASAAPASPVVPASAVTSASPAAAAVVPPAGAAPGAAPSTAAAATPAAPSATSPSASPSATPPAAPATTSAPPGGTTAAAAAPSDRGCQEALRALGLCDPQGSAPPQRP